MPRMWGIALRNGTLDRNAGRNVKRSADVSGNARHFCDGELNYMIWERTLRTESLDRSNARDLEQVVRMFVEMDVGPVSPSSTTWYEKKRSETNHWTGVTQGTWNKSCGYYGKWMSFLLFRIRIPRMWDKKVNHCEERSGLNHTSSPLPFPPISITIELTRKRSFPYAQKSRSRL